MRLRCYLRCQPESADAECGDNGSGPPAPTSFDGGTGKRRSFVRNTDCHHAAIGGNIIDAIENSDAASPPLPSPLSSPLLPTLSPSLPSPPLPPQRAEVVIVDRSRLSIPFGAQILKLPTSSRFLASTLIIGSPCSPDRGGVWRSGGTDGRDSGCLAPSFLWLTRRENFSLRSKRATVRGLSGRRACLTARRRWRGSCASIEALSRGPRRCRAPAVFRWLEFAAFFFRCLASAARAPPAATQQLVADQFPSPLGNRVRVQTEQIRNETVVFLSQRLQSRKQASLLFVKQAVEKEDPGLHNLGVGVDDLGGGTAEVIAACRAFS